MGEGEIWNIEEVGLHEKGFQCLVFEELICEWCSSLGHLRLGDDPENLMQWKVQALGTYAVKGLMHADLLEYRFLVGSAAF